MLHSYNLRSMTQNQPKESNNLRRSPRLAAKKNKEVVEVRRSPRLAAKK